MNDFVIYALIATAVAGVVIAFHFHYKGLREQAERDVAESKARFEAYDQRESALIAKHIGTLAIKYQQMVSQDDYGNFNFDRWFAERDYFIENVLVKDPILRG